MLRVRRSNHQKHVAGKAGAAERPPHLRKASRASGISGIRDALFVARTGDPEWRRETRSYPSTDCGFLETDSNFQYHANGKTGE